MNVQVITNPFGKLIWASPALPGAVHDLTAARTHQVIDALNEAGLKYFADKGYQGAGGAVIVPFRGKHRNLSSGKQAVNVAHSKIRAVGEQAMGRSTGRTITAIRQPGYARSESLRVAVRPVTGGW